jgi:hypothetical protein
VWAWLHVHVSSLPLPQSVGIAQSWDVRTLLAVGRAIAPTDVWYQQWLTTRDSEGNTALHLAVQVRSRNSCMGSLVCLEHGFYVTL